MKLILAVILLCAAMAPARAAVSAACVSYSPEGTLGTAEIRDKELRVQVQGTSGRREVPKLYIPAADGCRVSFSADNQLLGVTTHNLDGGVSAAVLDLRSYSWLTEKPTLLKHAEVLGGFMRKSHSIATVAVYANDSSRREDGAGAPLYVFIKDFPPTAPTETAIRVMRGSTPALFPSSLDAENNRLWYCSTVARCSVNAAPLVEGDSRPATVDDQELPGCQSPVAVISPQEQSVLVASHVETNTEVWRVLIAAHTSEHVFLNPSRHADFWATGPATHSADGSLVAFEGRVFRTDRFGGLHDAGFGVAVVQVEPLKLLDVVHTKAMGSNEFAVAPQGGSFSLTWFDGNRWIFSKGRTAAAAKQ